jgi:hypothetical protein
MDTEINDLFLLFIEVKSIIMLLESLVEFVDKWDCEWSEG